MTFTHEHTGNNPPSSEITRTERLRRMMDHVITRVMRPGVSDDDPVVAQIIENMKAELKTPEKVTFGDLEGLALLAHQKPDELDVIEPIISDTADLLFNNLEHTMYEDRKLNLGLSEVWAAIRGWDETRNPSTSRLCIRVLNEFQYSEGQAHLAMAYKQAMDESIPFDDALDQVNYALAA